MFEQFFSVFSINNDIVTLPRSLNVGILQNLRTLVDEFERYFLELNGDKLKLV